jgi:hypothetical protein
MLRSAPFPQMDAILSDFSPVPVDGSEYPLAVGRPLTAHEDLEGGGGLAGKVVVLKVRSYHVVYGWGCVAPGWGGWSHGGPLVLWPQRGQATFGRMAVRAQAVGAAGALVLNHVEVRTRCGRFRG